MTRFKNSIISIFDNPVDNGRITVFEAKNPSNVASLIHRNKKYYLGQRRKYQPIKELIITIL
jgi:hypothetical protein